MMKRGDVYYCEIVDMIIEILYVDDKNDLCLIASNMVDGELKIEKGPLKILESTSKILIDHLDQTMNSTTPKDFAAKVIKSNILFNKKNYKDVASIYFLYHKTAMFDVGNDQYIYVYTERFNQNF